MVVQAARFGSIEVGKKADLVAVESRFFGVKPEMVLMSGNESSWPRWATRMRRIRHAATQSITAARCFRGLMASALQALCGDLYLGSRAIERLRDRLGLRKQTIRVQNNRNIGKIRSDPLTRHPQGRGKPRNLRSFAQNGELLTCAPANRPHEQRISCF